MAFFVCFSPLSRSHVTFSRPVLDKFCLFYCCHNVWEYSWEFLWCAYVNVTVEEPAEEGENKKIQERKDAKHCMWG